MTDPAAAMLIEGGGTGANEGNISICALIIPSRPYVKFSHLHSATRAAREVARVAMLPFVKGRLLLAQARLLCRRDRGRHVGESIAEEDGEGME